MLPGVCTWKDALRPEENEKCLQHTSGLYFLYSPSPHKSDYETEQDETRLDVNDDHPNFVSFASESYVWTTVGFLVLAEWYGDPLATVPGPEQHPTLADLGELKGSMTSQGLGKSPSQTTVGPEQGRGAVDLNAAGHHLYLHGELA